MSDLREVKLFLNSQQLVSALKDVMPLVPLNSPNPNFAIATSIGGFSLSHGELFPLQSLITASDNYTLINNHLQISTEGYYEISYKIIFLPDPETTQFGLTLTLGQGSGELLPNSVTFVGESEGFSTAHATTIVFVPAGGLISLVNNNIDFNVEIPDLGLIPTIVLHAKKL